MGKKNKNAVIEKGASFSKSKLWDMQRTYFDNLGIEAWHHAVPFYITSNPNIANSYAQVFTAYMLEYSKRPEYVAGEPFYIVELATGSAKFSFHLLKKLVELKKTLKADYEFCYVLTDFTDNNINFWESQQDLKTFNDMGILDYAKYDIEFNSDIHLIKRDVTLSEANVKNPIMVIGNYTFDTISHDIFRVAGGQLQEATTVLKLKKPDDEETLDNVDVSFKYKTLKEPPYDNEALNQVLDEYVTMFDKDTTFLLPTATLRCIDQLKKISNDKMLIISTDKGYVYPVNIEGRNEPHVAIHGSFSMMVNFHAIGRYIELLGGDVHHQSIRKSIKTSLFVLGEQFENLPHTKLAIDNFIEEFGPGDFFNFHTHFKIKPEEADLEVVMSQLLLSRWDPRVFNVFTETVIENIATADQSILSALEEGVALMEENIYHMPGIIDYYFDIAVYYHAVGKLDDALRCYRQVYHTRPGDFSLTYNMALCEHFVGNKGRSLTMFQMARDINPDSEESEQWIETLVAEGIEPETLDLPQLS